MVTVRQFVGGGSESARAFRKPIAARSNWQTQVARSKLRVTKGCDEPENKPNIYCNGVAPTRAMITTTVAGAPR